MAKKSEEISSPSVPMEEVEKKKKKKNKLRKEVLQTEIQVDDQENMMSAKMKRKREEIQVKIQTICVEPEKASPLVGYFPSGFNPFKPLTYEGQGQDLLPRVRFFKNTRRSNRLELVVSPKDSQVNFVGTNYSGEGAAPQVCTYALGVLDKQTQTLKIVQIEANKIFRLEPRVGESNLGGNEPFGESNLVGNEPSDNLKAEGGNPEKLLKYSTKKTQRMAKKLETLRQKQDLESQEDFEKKIMDVKVNKEALEFTATTIDIIRNIPPYDLSADTPLTAYPLHKIIFNGEWDYLLDIVELLQKGGEVSPDAYPNYVCNRICNLEEVKDEEAKQSLGCIFSYINHLIKFKDKHSMDGSSSAKRHKIPSILLQKFSTMFAESDLKRLPDDRRDLLISYVLVLSLFADNFKTDPSDIAKDLRMNAVALRPHFENLGCKFVREGNVLLATLPVPLQFPVVKKRRRQK